MTILLFREVLRTDYRATVGLIDLMDGIKKFFNVIPAFSVTHNVFKNFSFHRP